MVLGLSGGADSVSLFHILISLQKSLRFTLSAVHVNHNLRGDESDEDESFVRKLCKKEGIALIVKHCDIEEISKKMKISNEEAGRYFRYKSFEECFVFGKNNKIATAHNMNDQCETMIMRFFRGTGIKGLGGIKEKNHNIIRPLIHCTRNEIESYCSENNLNYRNDSSNSLNIYTRNKIRNEIVPFISKEINPNIVETLSNLSMVYREEDEYLSDLCNENLEKLIIKTKSNENLIYLDRIKFNKLPNVLKRRILRELYKRMNFNLKDFTLNHVQSVLKLLEGETGKKFMLPNNILIYTEYNCFKISKEKTFLKNNFDYELIFGKQIYIDELKIYVSCSKEKIINLENFTNLCTKTFSYDKIVNSLHFRIKLPKDKIYLKGIGGSKKIKNYFIDQKIPQEMRGKIPLIADGSNILWIMDAKNITNDEYAVQGNENKICIQIWEDKK